MRSWVVWRCLSRSIPGAWRWRSNPLRRPSDLLDAWAGLLAVLFATVVAPLVGISVWHAATAEMRQAVVQQHADRHRVTAVVESVRPARGEPLDPSDPEADDGVGYGHTTLVDWLSADGSRHTAELAVVGRHEPGSRIAVWVDGSGRPVAAPLDASTAADDAIAVGFGAGVSAAALVMALRHLFGWHLHRRRLAAWEREWLRFGQDWGRADAGG